MLMTNTLTHPCIKYDNISNCLHLLYELSCFFTFEVCTIILCEVLLFDDYLGILLLSIEYPCPDKVSN